MASDRTPIDFQSEENHIFLNPRWPRKDYDLLYDLADSVSKSRGIQAHVWLATSGSTAENISAIKLVAVSKRALLSSAEAVNEHLQVTGKDIWTQVLPYFHVGGLGIEARAFLSGAQVVPALKEGRWEANFFHEVLNRYQCTLSALVPTQVHDLVQLQLRAPRSLRAIVVGGGVLNEELYLQARRLGWKLLPSYGMTETCSQIATADLHSLQSLHFPEMNLLSHARARTNEKGHLEVSSSSLFTCYAKFDGVAGKSWDPKIDSWFTTEDLGLVSERKVRVFGRQGDYLKIGGEATHLGRLRALLESAATELNPEWLQQVVLLDIPSDRLGAEIHMVSTLDLSMAEQVAQRYGEKVLPYEKVRKIHTLKEIPRSDLGKVLWGELRRLL